MHRNKLDHELAELRRQPPKVTPRKLTETPLPSSSPRESPVRKNLIYLPEYCPLTLKAVQANPNHLDSYRKYAQKMLEENLDEIGIDKVDLEQLYYF